MICTGSCEHLRSFRRGFDGQKILGPYNGRDRMAVCALRPEEVLHMRSLPACWRERDED